VPTGTCPECEADVHVDTDATKAKRLTGRVRSAPGGVGLDPVELDIVEEEDSDDDDDDDEF